MNILVKNCNKNSFRFSFRIQTVKENKIQDFCPNMTVFLHFALPELHSQNFTVHGECNFCETSFYCQHITSRVFKKRSLLCCTETSTGFTLENVARSSRFLAVCFQFRRPFCLVCLSIIFLLSCSFTYWLGKDWYKS